MQFNSSVQLAEILNRGFRSFKSTFRPFFKYALLAVMVSYIIQIYVAVIDTFLLDHEILYVGGIVLLVLFFIPIAYYTIRLNIVAAGKLKAIIEGQPFNFKDKFKESKHEFWRVFSVLAVKFTLRIVMYLSLIPVAILIIAKLNPAKPVISNVSLMMPIPSLLIAFCMLYLMTRLEFASLIVYWHADSDYSDLNTSMKMTQKQYFSKLKIMIIAHIPNMIMGVLTVLNFVFNYQSLNLLTRWSYLIVIIIINTVTLSWPMVFYYPLFKQLKAFKLTSDKVIDHEGKEWLTF